MNRLDSATGILALPEHGGDLLAAEARFGTPKDGWLDLSTGINPHPYPVPDLPARLWQGLPDGRAELALRTTAARAWGCDDPDAIVVGAGSQAMIQAIALMRPWGAVAVLEPTYSGYAGAFAHAGHDIVSCASLDELTEAPVAVVGNPNNPDGRRHAPQALHATAGRMAARGGLLVVDEAFADLAPELSVAGPPMPGLLVLRSFGKFFGLAGVRLGFAVCMDDLARRLRATLGPWPVSGPAMAIGQAALADVSWIAATRAQLAHDAARLDVLLSAAGLAILGGTDLFRLAAASRAWALHEHLGKRGILVRPFPEQPRWLRFGLPPDDAARERLAAALQDWNG